jgi:serine/threonine protein kinase
VRYEGFVQTEGFLNIVLEFVENGSLYHTLKQFGAFPEKLVTFYTVGILEGLNYLHNRNVIHCDLKAANILSTKQGTIKLSDFGVSKQFSFDVTDTSVAGTPNWMAPEIIELKGASTASDIWSLGCTLIELLVGKPPYSDCNPMTVLFKIVEDDRPPIPENLSSDMKDFLLQCFFKEPEKRPTAADLLKLPWLASKSRSVIYTASLSNFRTQYAQAIQIL